MGHRSDPLGPLPDVDDRVAFEQYVAATEKWRYFAINDQTLPKTEGGTVPFTIEKGKTYFGEDDEDSIFNGPATPAEVIVFALAQTVRTNPDIRKQLPDVSFFPFRKEHFFLGIPSLERPPPSGDDPIGDAGMGRGLLFLKWALEGAFLPPVGPFPQSLVANDPGNAEPPPPLDDLETRSQIFERIMEREEELVVEGYEWGAYQEFALLRESAHLRMERIHKDQEGNEIDRPRIFDDLAVAYENKIMKKVGKAVVRGMLAKMISDSTMRTAFLETDPKKFDETAALKSFEHLIAKTAKDNNFSGLTKDQIDDFLQAKLGDEKVFNKIRMDEDGVDEFIKKGFRFLREEVQEPLEDDFSDELDILEFHGRFYERGLRLNNSVAVDYGALLAASSSGRAQMHGVEGDYEAPFSFIVALHKRRNKEEATGLSIKLESDGNPMSLTCDNLKLDADRNVLVVNNASIDPMRSTVAEIKVGHAPVSIALSPDGQTAYVKNSQSFSVSEIDLTPLFAMPHVAFSTNAAGSEFPKFKQFPANKTLTTPQLLTHQAELVFAADNLPIQERQGRRLFTFARSNGLSFQGFFACATCHFEGTDDGLVWFVKDGPRQTPLLAQRLKGTAPFNWVGTAVDLNQNIDNTVNRMGGTGLTEEQVSALVAFLEHDQGLILPPNPNLNAEGLTASQENGKLLFYHPAVACADCHAGEGLTDGENWDVGTFTQLEVDIHEEFSTDPLSLNTPSLKGLYYSAPYLHDGSAATLYDVLNATSATMGVTLQLSGSQQDDLVNYLLTL